MKKQPNPGSDAAIKKGCICAIIDNHYGKGITYNNSEEPVFWITQGCPLHNPEKPPELTSSMQLTGAKTQKEREYQRAYNDGLHNQLVHNQIELPAIIAYWRRKKI